MTEKEKPEIERDEVMNNKQMLATEYDISIDQVTGKVYIAGNLDGSEVILQGILLPYKKDKDKTSFAAFDYTEQNGNKKALFSGVVYFEDIPCDITRNGTLVDDNVIVADKKEDTVEDATIVEVQDSSTQEIPDDIPDLTKDRPKTLRAPDGLSRSQRKAWWDKVRTTYPSCFDSTGNYIQWPKIGPREPRDWEKETEISVDNKSFEKTEEVKVEPKREPKVKPVSITGVGNEFTNMADQKVRNGYFMGKYFADKDAYSVVSTPSDSFEESRIIFCNKQRTAEMFLEAAKINPSFAKKLNGTERVFPSTNLKAGLFKEENLAYYVTNTVTALQSMAKTAVTE